MTTGRAGYHNVAGPVVGILRPAVGFNGLGLLGVPFWVQPVFNGAALLVAVPVARSESRKGTGGRMTDVDVETGADEVTNACARPAGVIVEYDDADELLKLVGGPFPSTTDSRHTSVGSTAIARFRRPVAYQSVPRSLRPVDLRS